MNTQQLLSKFNQGINWNAILSVSHRILSVILSISLYHVCTVSEYNLWANTYSIIFIILLWIDGGLRKSAPRFAPLFAAEGKTASFMKFQIIFQLIAITAAIPFVAMAYEKLKATLGVQNSLMIPVIIIFFLEGIISCIRLIYHSYFWNKSFNQIYVLLLTLETIITCFLIAWGVSPLIPAIFTLKIITCLLLIIITSRMIPSIINDPAYQNIAIRSTPHTAYQCTIHTIAMWGSNTIKSLSERNVMALLFTYLFGPEQANLFKIANDGAVIVYRTLVKTIGTTDTSLLAHSQIIGAGEVGLQKAFKKLSTKVAALCLPLLGLMAGMYTVTFFFLYDHDVFNIMFTLIMSYVLEVAFSSYERVLEVNFRYRYLIYAYIPYLVLILSPFLLTSLIPSTYIITRITCIGLSTLFISIRSVRLVSALLMVCFARRLYALEWPVGFRLCASRLLLFYAIGIPVGFFLLVLGRYAISFFPCAF